MKRKASTPPAPLDLPQPSVYNKPEAERAAQSLVSYKLSEEDRIALNEQYGYPTAPYKPPRGSAFVNSRKESKQKDAQLRASR